MRNLKHQDGKENSPDGRSGELATSLLEAGLIDEIRCNIHSLLLGSGVPLFHPMSRPIHLQRLDCYRTFENGCISIALLTR